MLSGVVAFGQAPEYNGDRIADIYLAKDDGTGKAGAAADGFLPTDVPIHCVVQLDSPKPATITMNLVAVNVAGVRPETRVVSTSFTTSANQDRVNFTGRPDGKWVIGKYRVDIFIGSRLAGSRDFTIQKTPRPRPTTESINQSKPGERPKPGRPT